MKRKTLAIAAAAPFMALPLLAAATPAFAADGGQTYTANLAPVPLNGQSSASATLTLSLNGDVATIHEQATGLAQTFMNAPFPHVQHIHGGAMGVCPSASADLNGDGLITTTEGQPEYGAIQTTLSTSGDTSPAAGTNVKTAPSGSSFTYDRTITLDAATVASIQKGIGVIVIHGLDPATAPKAATTEKSELVPSLPQAATAPALCGSLVSAAGAPATGGGSTSGLEDGGLLALGGIGLAAAGGALAYRRRVTANR